MSKEYESEPTEKQVEARGELDGAVRLLHAVLTENKDEYIVKTRFDGINREVDIKSSPHGIGICSKRTFKGFSSKACRYTAFPSMVNSGKAGISLKKNYMEIRIPKRR